MPATAEQCAWTERFLGVDLSGAGRQAGAAAPDRGRPPDTLALWRDAKDAIDTQIGRMQQALRGTGIGAAVELADKGLAGVTRNMQVRLMASLIDFDRCGTTERPKAADRVRAALRPLKGLIAADPLLIGLERNPFGIPVTIRATLSTALARIEQRL